MYKRQTYGIPKTDLIFDVLAMTISAEQEAAAVTLKALQLIRDELGAYTSLGVSNISFGLPQRENINAAFFTMAMQNGLSAAIMNPGSQGMMKAYYSYCCLLYTSNGICQVFNFLYNKVMFCNRHGNACNIYFLKAV